MLDEFFLSTAGSIKLLVLKKYIFFWESRLILKYLLLSFSIELKHVVELILKSQKKFMHDFRGTFFPHDVPAYCWCFLQLPKKKKKTNSKYLNNLS